MNVDEGNVKSWMKELDWQANPFSFKVYSDIHIGYEEQLNSVIEALESNDKFTVVLGPTGSGKTNMLRYLHYNFEGDYEVHYLPKPPVSEQELFHYLKDELLTPSFISRFLNSYSIYNIHRYLQKKLDQPTVLLIDEGHEAPVSILEWIRSALDLIDNLMVVTAGLPKFEDVLRNDVNTLYSRATDILHLNSLDKSETVDLVRKRIEYVGGRDVEPFTREALIKVYELTEGFPREVLRACNVLIKRAAADSCSLIDPEFVDRVEISQENSYRPKNNKRKSTSTDRSSSEDDDRSFIEDLNFSDKQSKVIHAILDRDKASARDIASDLGFSDYNNELTAIRSVNNMLKRLMKDNIVQREKKGRSYYYYLSQEVKDYLREQD